MAKFVASEAELVWEGNTPSLDVIARVRADIADSLSDLSRASQLVFHTVFLGEDMATGPVVMVWGKYRDKRLWCEYHASPEWVSLAEEPFQ